MYINNGKFKHSFESVENPISLASHFLLIRHRSGPIFSYAKAIGLKHDIIELDKTTNWEDLYRLTLKGRWFMHLMAYNFMKFLDMYELSSTDWFVLDNLCHIAVFPHHSRKLVDMGLIDKQLKQKYELTFKGIWFVHVHKEHGIFSRMRWTHDK